MPKQFIRKPFHYLEPKESLFPNETVEKVKKTTMRAEKQPRAEKTRQPGIKEKVKLIGKSI